MTIFEKQYQKILAEQLLKFYIQGRLPDINEIADKLTSVLEKDGKITYQYVPQAYRELFNIKLYNRALNQVKFDIDLFYEELLDLVNNSIKTVTYADLYNKVHNHELSQLEGKLNNILFITKDADFYFDGAFDDFSNTNKTDLSASTSNVVNLAENALSLPYGIGGIEKVKIDHMLGAVSWPIEFSTSSSNIYSHQLVPGSKFENVFIDTVSYWAEQVVSNTRDPVEIRLRFTLGPGETEILVNRLELIPQSTRPMLARIRVSTDDVNYFSPLGYEGGITLTDQKKVHALDFETNLVQYVELSLRKESPDSEIVVDGETKYQFIFGLRNFSAYKLGRSSRATYQSLPFSFSKGKPISKVSLSSESEIPIGTSIAYSIALYNGNTQVSKFLPITPVNTPSQRQSPTIVEFNNSVKDEVSFSVELTGDGAASQYGSYFQGKTFYRIGPSLPSSPIFGTALLYRGANVWYRDASSSFKIVSAKDIYVPFGQTDIEAFYDVRKEVATSSNLPNRQAALVLQHNPYYNNDRGHLIKPDASFQGTSLDLRPNYAIYSITQVSALNRRAIRFTLTTDRVQNLAATNISLLASSQVPVLYKENTNIQYRPGVDYELVYELVGNVPKSTGQIRFPDGSALLTSSGVVNSGTILILSYTPDPDITHKAISISSNRVVLDNCIFQFGDTVQVQYRFIPIYPNEIIQASIRVASGPSTSSSIVFYEEGTDYIVDPRTAAIQRISGGRIPDNGSIYVAFSYRNAEEGIQTFQTWCYLPSDTGTQIKFDTDGARVSNKLVANKEAGEAFYINYSDGLIDITNAVSTPILPQGWVQFIVRSKDPDSNSSYGTNLIDQVIQMRDEAKQKVFKQNGQYFSQIVALREPLKQKILNHLKVNVLKEDHSVFAIDDVTDPDKSYVVVNFLPNRTKELYCRVPSDELDDDVRPGLYNEVFTVSWNSIPASDIAGANLVVKIDLERKADNTDGGVTPKVHNYSLRVGY